MSREKGQWLEDSHTPRQSFDMTGNKKPGLKRNNHLRPGCNDSEIPENQLFMSGFTASSFALSLAGQAAAELKTPAVKRMMLAMIIFFMRQSSAVNISGFFPVFPSVYRIVFRPASFFSLPFPASLLLNANRMISLPFESFTGIPELRIRNRLFLPAKDQFIYNIILYIFLRIRSFADLDGGLIRDSSSEGSAGEDP